MRHSLLWAFAFILTLASACKKEDDDLSTPYVPPYRVSGVVDFSIQKYSFGSDPYQMYVSVEYENGEQERVTISLEDVPSGLQDSIFNVSGFPSFASYLTFTDSGVAVGDYTVKLVATGERSGRKEYPFRIRVLPVPNCSGAFTGQYLNSNSFCASVSYYAVTAQASPSITNRLIFSNLNANGLQLYADVNCNSGGGGGGSSSQVVVPTQTVNGITYSGSGYAYNSQGQQEITLYIQRSNGSSCTFYLER